MHRILTIDSGTHLGWCHGIPGKGVPIYGVHHVAGTRMAEKGLNLEKFLLPLIKGNDIREVICERPIMPRVTGFDSMMSMGGMAMAVALTTERCGVPLLFFDMQTWRKEFLGFISAPKMTEAQVMERIVNMRDEAAVRKWKEAKPETRKNRITKFRRDWIKNASIEECRKRGYEVSDDNIADAIGMYEAVSAFRAKKANNPSFDFMETMQI